MKYLTSKLPKVFTVFALMLFPFVANAELEPTPSPDGAHVYFVTPSDGDTVTSPVKVIFGLKGMGVAPAGIEASNTGHHHLIVDAPMPAAGAPIPADSNHLHFGGGQTETTIELAPGEHTLQLVLGDYLHRPHDKAVVSEVITINVE